MTNTTQSKALPRQGRHLEQNRTRKVNLVRSMTRRFHRAAIREKQAFLSMQVIRARMIPVMTDKKQRHEIVPRILSWKPRPSPLRSVMTQQDGAEAPALLEEKEARCDFNDEDDDDDDDDSSSKEALTACKEACEWWKTKGKVGPEKKAKEKALRKILEEKAEKLKMEASDM